MYSVRLTWRPGCLMLHFTALCSALLQVALYSFSGRPSRKSYSSYCDLCNCTMEGPKAYNFEPEFTEEELRERMEVKATRDSDTDSDDEDGVLPALARAQPVDDRMTHNNWCSCGNCQPIDSYVQCRCCREIKNCERYTTRDTVPCITLHEDFSRVCLVRAVLRTLLIARFDNRGHRRNLPQILENVWVIKLKLGSVYNHMRVSLPSSLPSLEL